MSNIERNYNIAKEIYVEYGVDTDAVLKKLAEVPISVHCWQIDDLQGWEFLDAEMTGGIAATGNAPGKAKNPEEFMRNLDKALDLIPGIVVGILVGMLNSFIIALITVRFRVPSMIVSLAMVKLHIGLFSLLPNAGYVSNIKASVTALGNLRVAGVIPVMLFLTLALLAFFCWFMKYTRYGRKVYAVGGSRESAILAGINADRITMVSFLISGALLGVTGVMYWLPRTQVQPSSCMGMEMFFLPIAVVGGISIAGGSGRPIGILVAGILIDLLQRAAYLLELGNQWMYLSYGVIVLVAVFSMVVDVDIPFLRWGKKQKISGGGSDA